MVHEISLRKGANLSHSELSEMHCISHGGCELEMHTDLFFEAKQIQFELEFHHII